MPNFLSVDKSIFSPAEADFSEIARYLGYRRSAPPGDDVAAMIKTCAFEMFEVINPHGVWETFELKCNTGVRFNCLTKCNTGVRSHCLTFADVTIPSIDLSHNLENCNKVTLLAATIGPQVDALIRRTQITDSVKASIFQATGAMYIEKVVDYINGQIKKDAALSNMNCKPRYSPGYGDVPLTIQKDFFRLLPCTKIGLTLMDTLIMSPEKSVTAFVGWY